MLLAVLALLAASTGDGWTTYRNPRFVFSVCYPAGVFRPGRHSDNGDGIVLSARDGAMLKAWGSLDVTEQGLAGEQRRDEERLTGITYRTKGVNWYVLSGRVADQIFYTKTFFDNGRFATFDIRYPASSAAIYASRVARMQRCFRYGRVPA